MRQDEYLSLTQPQTLLERTRNWQWWCPACGGTRKAGKCPSCRTTVAAPAERQLRLIACACYRFCRDELDDEVDSAALREAEAWADGALAGWVRPVGPSLPVREGREGAMAAVTAALSRSRHLAPQRLARTLDARIAPLFEQAERAAKSGAVALDRARQSIIRQFRLRDEKEAERLVVEDGRLLCDLIRDVLGDPYRPVSVSKAWLSGNRGLARAIAEGIAEEGRFKDLPILADALEEAGCDDEAILSHARQPRHYRGCWLVDAILGKS
jgi:hypothetical protein